MHVCYCFIINNFPYFPCCFCKKKCEDIKSHHLDHFLSCLCLVVLPGLLAMPLRRRSSRGGSCHRIGAMEMFHRKIAKKLTWINLILNLKWCWRVSEILWDDIWWVNEGSGFLVSIDCSVARQTSGQSETFPPWERDWELAELGASEFQEAGA